ncbi:MAG: hypothetical protein L0271_23175 [Gemmatimonadetes bacterium]|nr:hypothetical protein [Gemmatimonadota bacterium]
MPGAESGELLRRMEAAMREAAAAGVIACDEIPADETPRRAIASPGSDDDRFALLDLVEKPGIERAVSRLAVAGRYLFRADVFDQIRASAPNAGGEIDLTAAIRSQIAAGHRVLGVRLSRGERRLDTGTCPITRMRS